MTEFIARKITSSPCVSMFSRPREAEKTICVLGTARGGTSMVAGLLRKLGVAMGQNIDPSNNEDRDFVSHKGRRDVFEEEALADKKRRYVGKISALITKRNKVHDIWGWKDPLAPFYFEDIADRLRNPVFILVTRDIGAIAQREKIEEGNSPRTRVLEHMDGALGAYRRCIDIVRRRSRPTLLVSYERALRSPRVVGLAIGELLGIDAPTEFGDWVETYVRADRLDASLDATPNATSPFAQFASTNAIHTAVEESLRLWREGLLGTTRSREDIRVATDEMYRESAAALLEGRYDHGHHLALQIVGAFAPIHPELSDGLIGVLVEEAGGHRVAYPDMLCGAFYILGMSSLLSGAIQKAFSYMKVAESAMVDRIHSDREEAVLSIHNYGSCLFHLALCANLMHRADVVDYVARVLCQDNGSRHHFVGRLAEIAKWRTRFFQEVASVPTPAANVA